MARYQATIDTERSPQDVFAYLTDFSIAGVTSLDRIRSAAITGGTRVNEATSTPGTPS